MGVPRSGAIRERQLAFNLTRNFRDRILCVGTGSQWSFSAGLTVQEGFVCRAMISSKPLCG